MIGKLDTRIRLEIPQQTIDPYGQGKITYLNHVDLFAQIEYKASDEVVNANVKIDHQVVEFTVRAVNAVQQANKNYRIIFKNKVYDIEGITFLGRNLWAKIRAVSRGDFTTLQSEVQLAAALPSYNLPYTLPFLLG